MTVHFHLRHISLVARNIVKSCGLTDWGMQEWPGDGKVKKKWFVQESAHVVHSTCNETIISIVLSSLRLTAVLQAIAKVGKGIDMPCVCAFKLPRPHCYTIIFSVIKVAL